MKVENAAASLANAAAALVHDHDVPDLLLRLTRDATRCSGGDAGGLLVRSIRSGGLEVLAATDHRATHLEIYQAQRTEGPCVDVLHDEVSIHVTGKPGLVSRWPAVGRAIVDAGFAGVHAYPLRWRGEVVGGLNVFARSETHPGPDEVRTAQAFADLMTLVVTQTEESHADDLARRLDLALSGRVVVEQAKGALAQRLGIDMAGAYDHLLDRAEREGTSLTATAHQVLREAQEG
jgi:GAF domain-containing protein